MNDKNFICVKPSHLDFHFCSMAAIVMNNDQVQLY